VALEMAKKQQQLAPSATAGTVVDFGVPLPGK
jgi:hypothetical protein